MRVDGVMVFLIFCIERIPSWYEASLSERKVLK